MSRIKNIIAFLLFLTSAAPLINAQLIKYVSYFPIPYGNHSQINVKTLALLGTKEGGEVVVGSGTNATGGLTVASTFVTNDLSVKSSTDSGGTPDMYIGTASGSAYNGTLGSFSDIGVTTDTTTLNDVQAQGTAVIRSIYWDGIGGIGKNSSAADDWPSDCNLAWVNIRLKGSNSYRTYLSCNAVAVNDQDEEQPTTVTFQPYTVSVAVAKYCQTEHQAYFINWGKEYSYSTMNQQKLSYYRYADSITITPNVKNDSLCDCPAGTLSSSGLQDETAESGAPWAGVAVGYKQVGEIKKNDYTFVGSYSLNDCPTNLSEQQICDNNCSGVSCSYACVKSRTISQTCGPTLDTNECFCPKYGSCCGLCQDGTGQPACGTCNDYSSCCEESECGRTMGCAGSESGACGEFTKHRQYEPAVGTASVLKCRAISS